jgi:hypothetical protein
MQVSNAELGAMLTGKSIKCLYYYSATVVTALGRSTGNNSRTVGRGFSNAAVLFGCGCQPKMSLAVVGAGF